MQIGDVIELYEIKWIVCEDRSNKKHINFRLINKQGQQMLYSEVKCQK